MALTYEEVDYVLQITVGIFGISNGKLRARNILRNTRVEDNSACGSLDYARIFLSVGKNNFFSDVNFVLTPKLLGLIRHKCFVGRRINVGFIEIYRNCVFFRVAFLREFTRYDDFFNRSFASAVNSVFIGFYDYASLFFYYIGRNELNVLFVVEEAVVFKDVLGFSLVVIFSFFLSRNGKVIAA